MDFSKIKFLKPTCDGYVIAGCLRYLTKGKVYPVLKQISNGGTFHIVDDDNCVIEVGIAFKSNHLDRKGRFLPCYKNGRKQILKSK